MMDSVAGIISAEPTPWTTRAPISSSALPARPQKNDETVKIASPTRKMRLRPNMSASLPPVSISTAKLSAYPVTTHSSSDTPMPRSLWIAGSATFTIVLSSMIMKSANATDASVHHFLFSSAKIFALIRPPAQSC